MQELIFLSSAPNPIYILFTAIDLVFLVSQNNAFQLKKKKLKQKNRNKHVSAILLFAFSFTSSWVYIYVKPYWSLPKLSTRRFFEFLVAFFDQTI